MKKALMAAVLATGVGLTGLQMASANPGFGGPGMGGGYGQPGNCWQQPDEATKAKIQAFKKDNTSLRRDIVVKQTVREAIMMTSHPDPAAAAKVSGELFDLRQAMQKKAEAAGIASFAGLSGQGGPGGMGPGLMGGQFGPGHGPGMMARQGFGRQALDAETKAKVDKFREENKDIEKQFIMKMSTKQALMRSETIDYNAVSAIAGELFDLKETIQAKAIAAGVEQYVRPLGMGRGPGAPGMNRGPHHRGFGRS